MLKRKLTTVFCHISDDDFCSTECTSSLSNNDTDRTSTGNKNSATLAYFSTFTSPNTHREGLHQRSCLKGDAVRDLEGKLRLDSDVFTECAIDGRGCIELDIGAEVVTSYADQGGLLLGTFLTGIADENDHIAPSVYPARLGNLFGAQTTDWMPLAPEETIILESGLTAHTWSENIVVSTGKVIDTYPNGKPALVETANTLSVSNAPPPAQYLRGRAVNIYDSFTATFTTTGCRQA